jgi:transcriptional regulator with XRE-family HTH domain
MSRKQKPLLRCRFPKNSWNYRCLQLRHALGWSQHKLCRISGLSPTTVKHLESGSVTRPDVSTIRLIKAVEASYADVIKAFKQAPVRMDRLVRQQDGRVRLLPIEIRGQADSQSLDGMATDSDTMFFGRNTRRKMPQTGMSMQRKAFLARRGQAISRGHARKNAKGRSESSGDTKE